MRYHEEDERKIDRKILAGKGWRYRIFSRIFGGLIHRCVSSIVGRAYECGRCDSKTMHWIMDISHRATMPHKY